MTFTFNYNNTNYNVLYVYNLGGNSIVLCLYTNDIPMLVCKLYKRHSIENVILSDLDDSVFKKLNEFNFIPKLLYIQEVEKNQKKIMYIIHTQFIMMNI